MTPFCDLDEDLRHFLIGFEEVVENAKNQALTQLLVQLLRKGYISPANIIRSATYAFNDHYSNLDCIVKKLEDLIIEDLQGLSLQMTPRTDLERHTRIRDRISFILNDLKQEGVTLPQLIEATRDELQLLHIADEASGDELDTRTAGSSQTTDKQS